MSARGHFSSDQGGAVMHGEFMGFAMDEDSLAILRNWAVRQGFPSATAQQGGPDMFAQMLENAAPPKMAIVDIDGQSDPIAVITRLVNVCGPDARIVALGSANDVGLYRRMLASGAVDYLVKPLQTEGLSQALSAALKAGMAAARPENKEARTVVVLGARGGIGASAIAVNAGWLLAHELNLNIALLDLDLQFGTSSLALDLEPGRGLRDIVSSPHRVDGLMIASSMVTESDNFSVLAAEESIEEFVPIDNAAITALLKEMKGNFDIILVDLPRHLIAAQKRLLATADEIVLATELSLAGIRDTLRIKGALKSIECTAPVTIVATRINSSKAGHVDIAAFEKGAQVKIDLTVPEDAKAFAQAANSGKALGEVAKQAPATKAIQVLAVKLAGKAGIVAKPADGGFWKKLTGDKKPAARKKEKKS